MHEKKEEGWRRWKWKMEVIEDLAVWSSKKCKEQLPHEFKFFSDRFFFQLLQLKKQPKNKKSRTGNVQRKRKLIRIGWILSRYYKKKESKILLVAGWVIIPSPPPAIVFDTERVPHRRIQSIFSFFFWSGHDYTCSHRRKRHYSILSLSPLLRWRWRLLSWPSSSLLPLSSRFAFGRWNPYHQISINSTITCCYSPRRRRCRFHYH